jgi:hypothetical protein
MNLLYLLKCIWQTSPDTDKSPKLKNIKMKEREVLQSVSIHKCRFQYKTKSLNKMLNYWYGLNVFPKKHASETWSPNAADLEGDQVESVSIIRAPPSQMD